MAKSLKSLRAKDVMKKDVVTVNPRDSIHEALALMLENRVFSLPVTDGRGRCIGILSATDLLELTRDVDAEVESIVADGELPGSWLLDRIHAQLGGEYVDEVMTETVSTIGEDESVVRAVKLMIRDKIHRIPVINDRGALSGIVSTTDVLEAIAAIDTANTVC